MGSPAARPRRSWGLRVTAAGLGLVVGVTLAVAVLRIRYAPVDLVQAAAGRMLAARTATVTISGVADTIAFRGHGQLDLAGFGAALSMSGGGYADHEVVSRGTVYLDLVSRGESEEQQRTGRRWAAVPYLYPAAGDVGDPTLADDPAAALTLLTQPGLTVTPLGDRTMGGRTCQGFQAHPDPDAASAAAWQELGKLGGSAAHARAAPGPWPTLPAITAWFDPVRKLACAMSLSMNLDLQTGAVDVAGEFPVQITFTGYGGPVHVRPPAAADTAR